MRRDGRAWRRDGSIGDRRNCAAEIVPGQAKQAGMRCFVGVGMLGAVRQHEQLADDKAATSSHSLNRFPPCIAGLCTVCIAEHREGLLDVFPLEIAHDEDETGIVIATVLKRRPRRQRRLG